MAQNVENGPDSYRVEAKSSTSVVFSVIVDCLKDLVNKAGTNIPTKQSRHLRKFTDNLAKGVDYYFGLYGGPNRRLSGDKKPGVLAQIKIGQEIFERAWA